MKESYRLVADRFGIVWKGRRYDRSKPNAADAANQALNHAATAVQAAAAIAVTAVAALPQLGFIHEDSDQSFVLDVADLFRESLTVPVAFAVAKQSEENFDTIDRMVRQQMGKALRKQKIIPAMIDRIKLLMDPEDKGEA